MEKESGQECPEDCKFEVIVEAPNTFELVLPRKPQPIQATEELTEEGLEQVAGGGALVIGGKTWNFISRWRFSEIATLLRFFRRVVWSFYSSLQTLCCGVCRGTYSDLNNLSSFSMGDN